MDKEGARKKLSLPLNKKIVGFVGNLIEVKGADRLPAIARELMKLRSDVFFLIVGDGPLMKALRDRMPIENTRFIGRIRHDLMPLALNTMDVMVVASRNEGFPATILEARACGVWVIGTEAGGISEAIDSDGIGGIAGENIEKSLSEAINSSLHRGLHLASSRERVQIASWKDTVEAEVKVYRECLE